MQYEIQINSMSTRTNFKLATSNLRSTNYIYKNWHEYRKYLVSIYDKLLSLVNSSILYCFPKLPLQLIYNWINHDLWRFNSFPIQPIKLYFACSKLLIRLLMAINLFRHLHVVPIQRYSNQDCLESNFRI